jgi:hypothetical protein
MSKKTPFLVETSLCLVLTSFVVFGYLKKSTQIETLNLKMYDALSHFRHPAAKTEIRTLRCRYAVVSGWIVAALKVLDTLDPEDTAEADELHKLIKAGEVLALTALANSKTPNVEVTGLGREE